MWEGDDGLGQVVVVDWSGFAGLRGGFWGEMVVWWYFDRSQTWTRVKVGVGLGLGCGLVVYLGPKVI